MKSLGFFSISEHVGNNVNRKNIITTILTSKFCTQSLHDPPLLLVQEAKLRCVINYDEFFV